MKFGKTMFLSVAWCAILTPIETISSCKAEIPIIKTAVIPAAGLGTRFLPFTKAVPKEMLPLVSKPAIQHIIEELIHSNFSNLNIIVSETKIALKNYFDPSYEPSFLKEQDRQTIKTMINDCICGTTINYLTQAAPRGTGHAVYMAHELVKPGEYFAVLFPDDILIGDKPAIGMMAEIARQENATVIAVQEVPYEKISAYGVVGIKNQLSPDTYEITSLVEKPKKEDAPSNLAIVGRYILPYTIFPAIEDVAQTSIGEIQLTNAIQLLLDRGEKVIAFKFPHKRLDTGTPRGWLEAIIYVALHDPLYAPDLKKIIVDYSHNL